MSGTRRRFLWITTSLPTQTGPYIGKRDCVILRNRNRRFMGLKEQCMPAAEGKLWGRVTYCRQSHYDWNSRELMKRYGVLQKENYTWAQERAWTGQQRNTCSFMLFFVPALYFQKETVQYISIRLTGTPKKTYHSLVYREKYWHSSFRTKASTSTIL